MKKLNLRLISRDKGNFEELRKALAENELLTVSCMQSPEQVFKEIETGTIDVVIADDQVQGCSGLEFISQLVRVNPFINCALVSPLYAEEFHEATEGLGVFMQLPLAPGKEEAQKIYGHLAKIY